MDDLKSLRENSRQFLYATSDSLEALTWPALVCWTGAGVQHDDAIASITSQAIFGRWS